MRNSKTFFWIILGLIGGIVLYLVLSSETAATFGMMKSDFAHFALLSLWFAVIASAILPGRGSLREAARNAVLWLLIFILLAAGYVFRFDLQDIASRMTAGLVPGSPRSVQSLDGKDRVVLFRSANNHFLARMTLNGTTTAMLIDTGASSIVLTERDAAAAGIDTDKLDYSVASSTANGIGYFARAEIDTATLGPIERRNVDVLVGRSNSLGQSLLGMSFLNSLSAFEFRGEELYLTD
ncbi:MAG: TIGR02281 family clan AA aspartic protease [Rhizobiaceae bacterium]|nr:TIGR02281 family clan AA aspartic protease [Rhizobiaceae bacterium]